MPAVRERERQLLCDIGKYSTKFQGRIMGSGEKTDHATAGAQLCLRLGKEKGSYYVAPAYCIAGHHAGLPDTGTSADTGDRGTFTGRMKKRVEDYGAYQEEISIPPLPPPVLSAAEKKDLTFSMSFLIRMLYSCLVDADYLNTEDFMKDGETSRMTGETIPVLLEKLNRHIARWLVNDDQDTINGRRTEILKSCIEKGKKKKGLFRLTVPTGGGKTVASLAFALNHAAEHGMKRIIYVIPYTSIIEQNAKVFSHILGEENVLEHHSGIDYESTDELKLKQLATENWDLPIIVTTNVQFFESLFSNKSSKCRKLHNIANSVIIFDEAQMLPNDYLWPCIASMEELIRHYESSIVLCTATQPSLQNFFPKDMQYTELCPRMEEQFRFFKRAIFKNLGKITEDELLDRVRNEEQALCILNTKNNVQKLYEKIKGGGSLSSFDFYVSPSPSGTAGGYTGEASGGRKMYRNCYQSGGSRCGPGFSDRIQGTCRGGFHDTGSGPVQQGVEEGCPWQLCLLFSAGGVANGSGTGAADRYGKTGNPKI